MSKKEKATVNRSSKDDFVKNLAAQMAEDTGRDVTQREVREFLGSLETLVESYKKAAATNKCEIHVQLFGGNMRFVHIPEHESRNPRTGEKVDVPERVALRLSTAPKNVSDL